MGRLDPRLNMRADRRTASRVHASQRRRLSA